MRQHHLIAAAAAGAAVALVAPFGTTAGFAAPNNGRAAVRDAQPDWVRHSTPTGAANPSQQVTVKLYLAGQNTAGLASAVRAVSDPASPRYRHFLTPDQYRAQYAPSDGAVAAVRQFLDANGLKVSQIPDNRLYVAATGTVDAVQKAFQTSVKNYAKDGRTVRAAASQTTVPASLAKIVTAVSGIASVGNTMKADHTVDPVTTAQSRAAKATSKASPDAPPPAAFVPAPPCSDYFAQKPGTGLPAANGKVPPYVTCGYTPAQLQGAYGLNRAVKAGFDGRGVSVAIIDAYAAPTILADANRYATDHGQPAFRKGQFKQVLPAAFRYGYDDKVNGDQCGEQGWYGEETLDVEAVHAVAPGANVTYVAGASCDDGDLLDALNKVVDKKLANIVSNSWGSTGEGEDPDLLQGYQQVFFQGALEGIGFYFSSGDAGDNSTVNQDGKPSVNFPATDPLVTAVGGTSLAVDKNNGYGGETGWSTFSSTLKDGKWGPIPGSFSGGGGGGTSQLFDQPWYQQKVVPASIAKRYGKPARSIPDISAVGDANTGFRVGETQTFPDGSVKYAEYRIGGTSLSAPLTAGIIALADQISGRPHGFVNPAIYALAGSAALHDVRADLSVPSVARVNFNNNVDASAGTTTVLRTFNVKTSIWVRPGYDDVTGVGTPNGEAFLATLGYVH
ncbi:S53 family peptidase [Fodinicola acaciae]|uniref:S53 family peptidase n=1 Tax=Fodinicola acaciae TaxID=2681555 RepID=UPI0013D0907B|nr:S53 family peptidase [Fodinicola acaciae]